jgi:uncharacterized heparinase superfamily protein
MRPNLTGRPVLVDLPLLRRLPPLGPHPVRIARYVVFMLVRRVRVRVRRATYLRRVNSSPGGPGLLPVAVVTGRFADLPDGLRADAERIRAEADQILGHHVEYLGSGDVSLGPEIDWHRDFKSGYRWEPDLYLDVEVTRLDDSSDAKVPWELSRGHQLLTLARAACLYGDERYAIELEAQIESWLNANPPGYGINWVNAMEVGIRAVNWIWAIGTLEQTRPLNPELRARVATSLQAHGRHIAMNLEGSPFLRSNHYLSDLLGLLAIAACLPADHHARRWGRFARRRLEREVRAQTFEDGAAFEASLPYHGLALEIFLATIVLARHGGMRFSARYEERVRRMLDVSRSVRHPGGRTPIFGDNDSGRILPGGFDRPPTHDPLISVGSHLLDGEPALAGAPDPEVAWTLGTEAWREAAAQSGSPPERSYASFPHGGIYVLEGGGAKLVVRCGDIGQNGNGGHAHNDLLSYELSHRRPVILDSGTYAYTFDLAARNELRSTRAHNTLMIDGEEINPIPAAAAFKLAQVAFPEVESWSPEGDLPELIASHDGYRRLSGDVKHRRTFRLDRRNGELTITDEVFGAGSHAVESFLHLPADARVSADSQGATVQLPEQEMRISLEGSDEDPLLEDGWIADRYGVRERAPVLVHRREGKLPACLVTRVAIHASKGGADV